MLTISHKKLSAENSSRSTSFRFSFNFAVVKGACMCSHSILTKAVHLWVAVKHFTFLSYFISVSPDLISFFKMTALVVRVPMPLRSVSTSALLAFPIKDSRVLSLKGYAFLFFFLFVLIELLHRLKPYRFTVLPF